MAKEKVFKEYTGIVIFLKSNAGTKSEGTFPFLYVNKDLIIKIYKEDDNPFENKELLPFDGKKVKIMGYEGRGETFVVTEINEEAGENDMSKL